MEGPSLKPLRLKDNQGCILRLIPGNFVIIFQSLAANFEKVRQISVLQMFPKFLIYFISKPFFLQYSLE